MAADQAPLATIALTPGQHDPLRDGGRHQAERLAAAGVQASLLDYPMLHNTALPVPVSGCSPT